MSVIDIITHHPRKNCMGSAGLFLSRGFKNKLDNFCITDPAWCIYFVSIKCS